MAEGEEENDRRGDLEEELGVEKEGLEEEEEEEDLLRRGL